MRESSRTPYDILRRMGAVTERDLLTAYSRFALPTKRQQFSGGAKTLIQVALNGYLDGAVSNDFGFAQSSLYLLG